MVQPLIRGKKEGKPRMIFGSDGTDWIAALIDALGHLQVDVVGSGLPSGAATQVTLAACLTALQSLQNLVGALHDVGLDELDVQVAASVLPTGAATETSLEACETALEIIDDFADPDNLIFGYKERYLEIANATSDNGTKDVDLSSPASGEMWVVSHIGVYHNDPAARDLVLILVDNATEYRIIREPSIAQHEPMTLQGRFILQEGDFFRGSCINLATTKKVYIVANGYKMSVA